MEKEWKHNLKMEKSMGQFDFIIQKNSMNMMSFGKMVTNSRKLSDYIF